MCKSIQKREEMIDQKGLLILFFQEFLDYTVRSFDKEYSNWNSFNAMWI